MHLENKMIQILLVFEFINKYRNVFNELPLIFLNVSV